MIGKFIRALRHPIDWVLGHDSALSNAVLTEEREKARQASEKSRRIWLIDNHMDSLRQQIDKAKRQHKPRNRLYDRMQELRTERIKLVGDE